MDQIGEIILRLRITQLEAHLVLLEIERAGLARQIDDLSTDGGERYLASIRRERVIIEWAQIMTELQELRDRYGRELELMPRVELD